MQKTLTLIILIGCLFLLGSSSWKTMSYRIDDTLPENKTQNSNLFCLKSNDTQTSTLRSTTTTLSAITKNLPKGEAPTSLYSRACALMDADTGRLLYGKEENTPMPMASTTKIMTCIIALEYGNLSDKVTTSAYAASMPDVQLNMREGDVYILQDLLYSLMLESHNDTAVAIAEHIGGSVEGFARLMNDKADELGLTKTHFVTPNGLDDDNHYTTAKELAEISAYAITNPDFVAIVNTPSYDFTEQTSGRSYHVTNRDAFLTMYEGAIGIKTGFTNNAGYCFAGAVKAENHTYISTVLACGWPPNKSYKWSDTTKLMNYAKEGFTDCQISPGKTKLSPVPVENGKEASVKVRLSDSSKIPMLLSGNDTVTRTITLPDRITAPVREGDILGSMTYRLNGTEYAKIPIIAAKSVEKLSFSDYTLSLFKLFCP